MGVSMVPVRDIALALFTRISMPPNFLTVSSTAFLTCSSERISTIQGRHFPPAASTTIIQDYSLRLIPILISIMTYTTVSIMTHMVTIISTLTLMFYNMEWSAYSEYLCLTPRIGLALRLERDLSRQSLFIKDTSPDYHKPRAYAANDQLLTKPIETHVHPLLLIFLKSVLCDRHRTSFY